MLYTCFYLLLTTQCIDFNIYTGIQIITFMHYYEIKKKPTSMSQLLISFQIQMLSTRDMKAFIFENCTDTCTHTDLWKKRFVYCQTPCFLFLSITYLFWPVNGTGNRVFADKGELDLCTWICAWNEKHFVVSVEFSPVCI